MDEAKYNVSDKEMTSLVEALDNMLDEEEPDFYGDLKEAAWNVLRENPSYGLTSGYRPHGTIPLGGG